MALSRGGLVCDKMGLKHLLKSLSKDLIATGKVGTTLVSHAYFTSPRSTTLPAAVAGGRVFSRLAAGKSGFQS